MKKKLLSSLSLSTVAVATLGLINQTYAAEFLPGPIQNLFDLMGEGGSGTGEFAASRIQMLLLLGLGVLILASVIYAALAAFKYIQSQGDPGKIEEAGKAVKAIFTGLVVMLISIVGIVLVFVFFGADFFGTSSFQTCLSAANSPGCIACRAGEGDDLITVTAPLAWPAAVVFPGNPGAGSLPDNWDIVKFQGSAAAAVAAGEWGSTTGPQNDNQAACTACEWEYFAVSNGTPAGVQISTACGED